MGGSNPKLKKLHDLSGADPTAAHSKDQEGLFSEHTDPLYLYTDPIVEPAAAPPDPANMPTEDTKKKAKRTSVRRQTKRRGRKSTIMTPLNSGGLGG